MMYAATGRPSIPPEMLLLPMLLRAFFTVRSERRLMQLGNPPYLMSGHPPSAKGRFAIAGGMVAINAR